MTRPTISIRSAVRSVAALVASAWLVLVPATGSADLPAPWPTLTEPLEALAVAMAESVEARCSAGFVRIVEARGDEVRIDRGSRGGLRPFTRVTLNDSRSPAWPAEVSELTEESTWLKPATPGAQGPAVGTTARIRLDVGRLALTQPDLGEVAPNERGVAKAWHNRMAHHASLHKGI